METGLFVKAGWWHRISGIAPNGDALTPCGISAVQSMVAGSIDAIEQGNGCPDCLPERADEAELAKIEDAAAEAVELPTLSAVELRALAAERGVTVKFGMTKAAMADALAAAPVVLVEPEAEA
jgi:hypothetical protein